MKITTKYIGSNPASIVELIIQVDGNTFTIEVTDRFSAVPDELIEMFRGVVDELIEHNIEVEQKRNLRKIS